MKWKSGDKKRSTKDIILTFFFFWIYLFMRDTERDAGRGRSRLHAGSPTWDSIQGLQDHALDWRRRQTTEPPGLTYIHLDFSKFKTMRGFSHITPFSSKYFPSVHHILKYKYNTNTIEKSLASSLRAGHMHTLSPYNPTPRWIAKRNSHT